MCANSLTNQLALIAVLRVAERKERRDESGFGEALYFFNECDGGSALFNNNCVCCVINFGLKCKARRDRKNTCHQQSANYYFTFEERKELSLRASREKHTAF